MSVSRDKGGIGSTELLGYLAVAVPHRLTDQKAIGRLDGWRQHFEHFIIAALGDFFPCGHRGGAVAASSLGSAHGDDRVRYNPAASPFGDDRQQLALCSLGHIDSGSFPHAALKGSAVSNNTVDNIPFQKILAVILEHDSMVHDPLHRAISRPAL